MYGVLCQILAKALTSFEFLRETVLDLKKGIRACFFDGKHRSSSRAKHSHTHTDPNPRRIPCVYSGPFPPLDCPNLHTDIDYVGCYEADQLNDALNWVMMDEGPHGTRTAGNGVQFL